MRASYLLLMFLLISCAGRGQQDDALKLDSSGALPANMAGVLFSVDGMDFTADVLFQSQDNPQQTFHYRNGQTSMWGYSPALVAVPAGSYIITAVQVSQDWGGKAGVHPITGLPYYGAVTLESGTIHYLGTLKLGTDGTFYQQAPQDGQLGTVLAQALVNALASPFKPEDVTIAIDYDDKKAREFLADEYKGKPYPPLQRTAVRLGYWAKVNQGD